jgi:hypothetical protein
MRPDEASRPEVPGDTEAARMDAALWMLFKASKAEYVKQETNDKRTRERKAVQGGEVKFNPKYSITAGILLIVLKVSQWILQWPNPEPSSAYFWVYFSLCRLLS